MDPIQLLIILVIIGFAGWLVLTYVPMASPVKTVIVAVGAIILALWLLSMVGIGSFHLERAG